jgi:hypothetical protein
MSTNTINNEKKTIRMSVAIGKKLLDIAKANAKQYDLTFSEFVRQALIEKIEKKSSVTN